jgi:hypothetical protein
MPTPAGPETNRFRCDACGRWLNTESELAQHQTECELAKRATESGRQDLKQESQSSHSRNDHDSTEHPFQHGTGEAHR